jgi:aspartyl-tRNA(Asn)/glutamyl-tRNA(Gln) amidotransferase subunit B
VGREGLTQVANREALASVIDHVLAAHPRVVQDYKAGKKAAAGFLMGQVMKATQGRANPALVNELLAEKLPKT